MTLFECACNFLIGTATAYEQYSGKNKTPPPFILSASLHLTDLSYYKNKMISKQRRTKLVRPGEGRSGRLVGSGEGFSTLQYVLSGGMSGSSHSIVDTELPLTQVVWRDVSDVNYPGTVVIVADADPRNTDNSLYVMGIPTDIDALPRVFSQGGPLWTLSTIGALPLNSPVQRSYDVAGNFGVLASQTSNITVTPTRIGAGSDNLQGLITTAVVTTKPLRANATRAALAGLVSGHEHYRSSTVNDHHTIILAGNGQVEFISGQSVDAPGATFVSSKEANSIGDGVETILDWCGEGGTVPEYYSGPVDITYDASVEIQRETSLDESINVFMQLIFYFGNVNSTTGELEVTTTFTGSQSPPQPTPNDAISLKWQGNLRVENPTNVGGTEGYASFLLGYSIRLSAYNYNSAQSHPLGPFNSVIVRARYPSQSPSGNGPASITVVDGDYNGPIDVTRVSTGYGLPNAERAADYRNSMSRPAPSYVGDAVRTGLYCVFHAAQGIAFVGQPELDEYLNLVSDPSRLLKLIAISSMNNDVLSQNVQQLGLEPGLSQADRMAVEDAGMGPLTLGASMAEAKDQGAPTYKAGLFDFISRGLGTLGGIAKGVTSVACNPAVSSIIDGMSSLGAARYDASRYNSAYDDVLAAAARYRAGNMEQGPPPSFNHSNVVSVGKTPVKQLTPQKPPEINNSDGLETVAGKPLKVVTQKEVAYKRHRSKRRRLYSASCSNSTTPLRGRLEELEESKDGSLYRSTSKGVVELTEHFDNVMVNHELGPTAKYSRENMSMVPSSTGIVDIEDLGNAFVLLDGNRPRTPRYSQQPAPNTRTCYRASVYKHKPPKFAINTTRVGLTPGMMHGYTRQQNLFAASTSGSQARRACPGSGYETAAKQAGINILTNLKSADAEFEYDDDGLFDGVLSSSDADVENDAEYIDDEEVKQTGKDEITTNPDIELSFGNFVEEIPTFIGPTHDQFEQSMKQVAMGFYPNVESTGAGPLSSAGATNRLRNLTKDVIQPILPSCANFPLVMGDSESKIVHIATLCLSSMPVARGVYGGDTNIQETAEALKNSYYPPFNIANDEGGKLTVLVDIAFKEQSRQYARDAIKQAFSRYPPQTRETMYVSVVLPGEHVAQGQIEGNSFTLALFATCLGIPCGPTLTGAISKEGPLAPIGEINAKLNVFINNDLLKQSRLAPIIYPRNSLDEEVYETRRGFKDSDMLTNIGSFGKASKTGVIPIRGLPTLIAFFLGGGYDSWATRNVSKEEKQVMDRYQLGWKSAVQYYRLVVKIQKLKQQYKSSHGDVKKKLGREILDKKPLVDELNNKAFTYKLKKAVQQSPNMEPQQSLADAARKAKEAIRKVTTNKDGGKYYFQNKSGAYQKELGPAGLSKSSKKEWARKNLVGETLSFKIRTKENKVVDNIVFIPKIVEGSKTQTSKKKAKSKALDSIQTGDLSDLFDVPQSD